MTFFAMPRCITKGAVLAFAAVALLLAGCNTEDYRNAVNERTAIAEQRVEEARQPAPARRYNPLTVTDSIWTGARAVRMRHGIPLPERVENNRAVAIVSNNPMSLRAIASAITSQTGIPVRLGKDADEGGGDDDLAPASSSSAASSGSSTAGAAATAPSKPKSSGKAGGLKLAYEGTLSGLLDRVSGAFGVSWKYDGGVIALSKYETRVFVIDSLPGTQSVKDGMKEDTGGGGGSSSGGAQVTSGGTTSSDQSSSMGIDFKFWEEVGKTIETILAGVGSYSLAPSSGTITVVTSPEAMRTVAEYVNQENDRLSRQVAINVEVYTVDLNEGEDFNVKFDNALRRLADFGLNFSSAGGPALTTTEGLGKLSIAVFNPEKQGEITSVFGLLSSVGKTSRVAQFPMTTLNNRPVSRRIGRDKGYLASVQTNTSQSFQNITLTPGIVRDGFSIQVTPRILGDGRILLQYSLSLVDLLEIVSFSSTQGELASGQKPTGNNPGNIIQLPTTASRLFVQQAMLRSGSTLVLAGFDQDQVGQRSSGVGNPDNYLLGGGVANTRTRQVLFIAMTPQEISLPRTENE